jgi:hypothetical protein
MIDVDFSDMSEPAESRPTKSGSERGEILFINAPAVNSIEISIREMMAAEPALCPEAVEFMDATGTVEEPNKAEIQMRRERLVNMGLPPNGIEYTAEIGELRDQIFAHLQEHASLARSLGECAKYEDYIAACKRESMTPLALRDYSK